MADKLNRINQTILFSKVTRKGNLTMWLHPDGEYLHFGDVVPESDRVRDGWHAGYYVIIVILVYGMSIVMLIASHINRKHRKLLEDRQIHKYLKEFQVVKERSSRDSYRNLKKAIVAKLHRGGGGGGADRSSNSSACVGGKSGGIYRCISKSVLPVSTLAFPSAMSAVSIGYGDDVAVEQTISTSRETLSKERNRNEACLCNLYVIEEFEGEQKQGRPSPDTAALGRRALKNEDNRHASHYHGQPVAKGAFSYRPHLYPKSMKCVTAEINLPPPSVRSITPSDFVSCHSDVLQISGDKTTDQHEVNAQYRFEESDATQQPNIQGQEQYAAGQKLSPIFSGSHQPPRNVAQVHVPSPKRRSPFLSTRPSQNTKDNLANSPTPHRNTNLLQISTV